MDDDVVNTWLSRLAKEVEQKRVDRTFPMALKVKCFFFDTFATAALKKTFGRGKFRGSTLVGTCFVGLQAYEKIFFPVHESDHWTLVVISTKDCRFEYYDSMVPKANLVSQHFKSVKDVLELHAEVNNMPNPDFSLWTFHTMNCPKQDNGFDCALYMLKYSEGIAYNLGVYHLLNANSKTLRDRVKWELYCIEPHLLCWEDLNGFPTGMPGGFEAAPNADGQTALPPTTKESVSGEGRITLDMT